MCGKSVEGSSFAQDIAVVAYQRGFHLEDRPRWALACCSHYSPWIRESSHQKCILSKKYHIELLASFLSIKNWSKSTRGLFCLIPELEILQLGRCPKRGKCQKTLFQTQFWREFIFFHAQECVHFWWTMWDLLSFEFTRSSGDHVGLLWKKQCQQSTE